jgi:hypothetical protein
MQCFRRNLRLQQWGIGSRILIELKIQQCFGGAATEAESLGALTIVDCQLSIEKAPIACESNRQSAVGNRQSSQ